MLPPKNSKVLSQKNLILEYFKSHPHRDIKHKEIVDWATAEWKKRMGSVFRDPDRAIRKWHQDGYLQKIAKGIYRYDPDSIHSKSSEDFTARQKQEIFKRDGYKCVICGQGKREGLELHADHIKAKDQGGKATLENGQTLCSGHNMFKKNFKQTETGKRLFIGLRNLAQSKNDQKLLDFCEDILAIYNKHKINGHILWDK